MLRNLGIQQLRAERDNFFRKQIVFPKLNLSLQRCGEIHNLSVWT